MQYFINSAWTIFRKDLILELRTRENIGTILPFSIVIAFIFNFTFDPSPQLMATVGPGIIWVAFIFSGTLGMNRLFLLEREFGTLEGLLTSPIPRESIFIGILEGVHPEDAKLVISMINKEKIKGLSRPVIEEAFPNLLKDYRLKLDIC